MAGKNTEKHVVSEAEIIRLFWQGLSKKMLRDRVALREGTGKKAAWDKVERVLYADEMERTRKAREERAKAQ